MSADRRHVAELCRQAEGLLASLCLPDPFTLPQLHERVERRRGRQVRLIPRRLPVLAPHGLWVAGEHADYVFYDCSAGPVRQTQIIGHEFGHMLCDDRATPTEAGEMVAMLLPDVDATVVTNLQRRTSYTVLAERRAEVFGSVALQRMEGWTVPPPDTADPAVVARLTATLERGVRQP